MGKRPSYFQAACNKQSAAIHEPRLYNIVHTLCTPRRKQKCRISVLQILQNVHFICHLNKSFRCLSKYQRTIFGYYPSRKMHKIGYYFLCALKMFLAPPQLMAYSFFLFQSRPKSFANSLAHFSSHHIAPFLGQTRIGCTLGGHKNINNDKEPNFSRDKQWAIAGDRFSTLAPY